MALKRDVRRQNRSTGKAKMMMRMIHSSWPTARFLGACMRSVTQGLAHLIPSSNVSHFKAL